MVIFLKICIGKTSQHAFKMMLMYMQCHVVKIKCLETIQIKKYIHVNMHVHRLTTPFRVYNNFITNIIALYIIYIARP